MADLLAGHGLPPLPPYIRRYRKPGGEDWRTLPDRVRHPPGAVAAPTAGLHFTPALLAALGAAGVEVHRLTLHVGPGTFRPVRAARVADHAMEAEWCRLTAATAEAVGRARREGRRVVAVGTTTVRALESADGRAGRRRGRRALGGADHRPRVPLPRRGRAPHELPPPRSSLLLLVAAFAGRPRILEAYRHAIAAGYRFFSYGDTMLIL